MLFIKNLISNLKTKVKFHDYFSLITLHSFSITSLIEFFKKFKLYNLFIKNKDLISDAICIGTLFLIGFKFSFSLIFNVYPKYYYNISILFIIALLAFKYDIMEKLKYNLGYIWFRYAPYSLYSEVSFHNLTMINNGWDMSGVFKPTWFRLLEDFFIFLIYIRLIINNELFMFIIIRFSVFSMLITNKFFLIVAILSLLNIGGRILYNFSFSNSEMEVIKEHHFFRERHTYIKDHENLRTPFYIQPTWNNAMFMYLACTVARLHIDLNNDGNHIELGSVRDLYTDVPEWFFNYGNAGEGDAGPVEFVFHPLTKRVYDRFQTYFKDKKRRHPDTLYAIIYYNDVWARMFNFFVPIQYFNRVVTYEEYEGWCPDFAVLKLDVIYTKNYIFKVLSLSLLYLLFIYFSNKYGVEYATFMQKVPMFSKSMNVCRNKGECDFVKKNLTHRMPNNDESEFKQKNPLKPLNQNKKPLEPSNRNKISSKDEHPLISQKSHDDSLFNYSNNTIYPDKKTFFSVPSFIKHNRIEGSSLIVRKISPNDPQYKKYVDYYNDAEKDMPFEPGQTQETIAKTLDVVGVIENDLQNKLLEIPEYAAYHESFTQLSAEPMPGGAPLQIEKGLAALLDTTTEKKSLVEGLNNALMLMIENKEITDMDKKPYKNIKEVVEKFPVNLVGKYLKENSKIYGSTNYAINSINEFNKIMDTGMKFNELKKIGIEIFPFEAYHNMEKDVLNSSTPNVESGEEFRLIIGPKILLKKRLEQNGEFTVLNTVSKKKRFYGERKRNRIQRRKRAKAIYNWRKKYKSRKFRKGKQKRGKNR